MKKRAKEVFSEKEAVRKSSGKTRSKFSA